MRVFPLALFIVSFMIGNIADASVVMTGTRIIFPESAKEKTIQLKNMDSTPYIVQIQLEKSDAAINALSQFLITPQIFRVEPNSGQSIRMINTGGGQLPNDRESIFYLSFTQLPAINKNDVNTNKLVIAITNKVKVFYRPKSISGSMDAEAVANALKFQLISTGLQISNPDSHYLPVRHATLVFNNKTVALATNSMLAPRTTTIWSSSTPISNIKGASLRLVLVNDYGVDVTVERKL